MNLDGLLKDVVIEKAIDPENTKNEVYRAVYQLAGKNPIILTGWFKSIEKAIEAAKENLLLGILDGKQVKINNEDGLGSWVKGLKSGVSLGALSLLGNYKNGTSSVLNFASDKLDDIKSLLKKLFLFKNGKALLNGNENEIGSGLLKLFGNFDDVEPEAIKTHNSVLLENASKVLKRVNPDEVSLEDLDVLVNDKDNKGLRFLDKLVDNSKEDLKEENKSLKDYFLSYFDGLKGKKDASPLYSNTKPLRDKLAALLGGFKSGSLPGIGSLAGLGLTGYKALDSTKDVTKTAPVNNTNVYANKKDDDKKKGGLLPKLLLGAGALGLLSTPFWAIPYKVNVNVPLGATLKGNLPEKVKFYEKFDLPEASFGDMKFEGWFTDPEFKNPIKQISSTLGSKNLYPKFAENFSDLQSNVEAKMGDLSKSLDGLKGIVDLPDAVKADLQKEYDDINVALDDVKAKFETGPLTGDLLKTLDKDLDDLNIRVKDLQGKFDEVSVGDVDSLKANYDTKFADINNIMSGLKTGPLKAELQKEYDDINVALDDIKNKLETGPLTGELLNELNADLDALNIRVKDLQEKNGSSTPSSNSQGTANNNSNDVTGVPYTAVK